MEKRTVKWYMEAKGLLSFNEDEEAVFVSEDVKGFLSGNPIKEGDVVEAEYGKDDDGDTIVTKVVVGKKTEPKKEKAEKKEEVKEEDVEEKTEDEPVGETRKMTVGGVSFKNSGMIFVELENTWFDVDIEDIKARGIKRGSIVEITSEEQDGKKNDKITSIKKVGEAEEGNIPDTKKSSNTSSSTNSTNSYAKNGGSDTQRSIEAQAAVNAANNTVANIFAGKFDPNSKEDAEMITKIIATLAKHNHKLVQELKS